MNNFNDLFLHKICCSINVQYNVHILGAVKSTRVLKVGI